jgi:hypothetical protein
LKSTPEKPKPKPEVPKQLSLSTPVIINKGSLKRKAPLESVLTPPATVKTTKKKNVRLISSEDDDLYIDVHDASEDDDLYGKDSPIPSFELELAKDKYIPRDFKIYWEVLHTTNRTIAQLTMLSEVTHNYAYCLTPKLRGIWNSLVATAPDVTKLRQDFWGMTHIFDSTHYDFFSAVHPNDARGNDGQPSELLLFDSEMADRFYKVGWTGTVLPRVKDRVKRIGFIMLQLKHFVGAYFDFTLKILKLYDSSGCAKLKIQQALDIICGVYHDWGKADQLPNQIDVEIFFGPKQQASDCAIYSALFVISMAVENIGIFRFKSKLTVSLNGVIVKKYRSSYDMKGSPMNRYWANVTETSDERNVDIRVFESPEFPIPVRAYWRTYFGMVTEEVRKNGTEKIIITND